MNKVNGFFIWTIVFCQLRIDSAIYNPGHAARNGFLVYSIIRFLFAMLALAGILLLDKQPFRIRRKEILPLLLLACLYDSSAVFLFWGYQFMSSGVATTLHFMYPVLTTLIMMIFFHEKKSLWRMAAIALAVAGVFFLSNGDGTGSVTWSGIFIVLLSALGYALYLVTVSQLKNLEMKGLKMTFYVFLFGGILLFTGTEISGIGFTGHSGPHHIGQSGDACVSTYRNIQPCTGTRHQKHRLHTDIRIGSYGTCNGGMRRHCHLRRAVYPKHSTGHPAHHFSRNRHYSEKDDGVTR